jgi:hypothetical protein
MRDLRIQCGSALIVAALNEDKAESWDLHHSAFLCQTIRNAKVQFAALAKLSFPLRIIAARAGLPIASIH